MLLLSSGAFEREIIEGERRDHLSCAVLAYLLQVIAENYEFATHTSTAGDSHSAPTHVKHSATLGAFPLWFPRACSAYNRTRLLGGSTQGNTTTTPGHLYVVTEYWCSKGMSQFKRSSRIWRLSGRRSPFSTRLTMSVSAAFAGVATPTCLLLSTMKPLRNSISVRRPLTMSWPIDGRMSTD